MISVVSEVILKVHCLCPDCGEIIEKELNIETDIEAEYWSCDCCGSGTRITLKNIKCKCGSDIEYEMGK
jgi:hypothetical protein